MSRRELTPSEYEEMASSRGSKSSSNGYGKYGVILVSALVLCGVSFWAGTAYQKSKQSNTVATTGNGSGSQNIGMGNGPGGFSGGPRSGQRPNIGEVTAISSDSITIQDSRSNSKQTFKITSDTTIQDNGSTVSATNIKAGDTALVIADSSDASTASQIMLNPSFNGPQPGGN